ncbi:MAG: sugar-binding domain-containing protein [Limisphaerales bacterium]
MFCSILTSTLYAADTNSPRERLSLDANWKFHLGDDWPNALNLAKAGENRGPAAEKFNDNSGARSTCRNDWAIELPFDKNSDGSHGFKPVGPGFPQNSIGWYRRTFELPKEDSGKRIWLTFDGVFRDATVWVNGWLVTRHEGGYYPFREDITDVVKFGGKNVITVKVDASQFEGWFYEGAGIYRHVWLDKTAPVAIAPDGVFVWSEFKNKVPEGAAKIHVHANVKNFFDAGVLSNLNLVRLPVIVSMSCQIYDPNGKAETITVMTPATKDYDGNVADNLDLNFFGNIEIENPNLWSPENPKLYKLVTTVKADGKVVDQ